MVTLANDLTLALDRVAFARSVGVEPDDWQQDALRSTGPRQLYNCARQTGKSTISAILATHTALYEPGSLVLLISPTLRQSGNSSRSAWRSTGRHRGPYHLTRRRRSRSRCRTAPG